MAPVVDAYPEIAICITHVTISAISTPHVRPENVGCSPYPPEFLLFPPPNIIPSPPVLPFDSPPFHSALPLPLTTPLLTPPLIPYLSL